MLQTDKEVFLMKGECRIAEKLALMDALRTDGADNCFVHH